VSGSEEIGRRGLDAIRLGDLEAATGCASALKAHGDAGALEWADAIAAECWHADPARGAIAAEPRSPRSGGALEPFARAMLSAARRAHLALDPARARPFLAAVAAHADAVRAARVRFEIELAFSSILSKRPAELSEGGDPDAVVDRTALRALELSDGGSSEEALATARRASRMARTEGAPQREYFANLVLARVRRIDGHTHLAQRILRAIARVAPDAWHDWLALELALAGAGDPARGSGTPASEAAALLASLTGHRATARVAALAREVPFLAADLETALALVDPERPIADLDGDLRAWASGERDEVPRGLVHLGGVADEGAPAIVVAIPGREARRYSRRALGFLRIERVLPEPGRIEGLTAALLLAGSRGLDEPSLFERVYGFRFRPGTHAGALRVALSRARRAVPELSLDREGDRIVASVRAPIAVADPRCTRSMNDRVLHLIATRRGASAREVAELLDIPLRNAQRALASLADDGWCDRVGRGPSTTYAVEDTTFQEPTRSNVWRPVR
jgi:hypothetical protein